MLVKWRSEGGEIHFEKMAFKETYHAFFFFFPPPTFCILINVPVHHEKNL